MDIQNFSEIPTAASRTSVHIGAVGLVVRDLDRLTTFHQEVLGFTLQERKGRCLHSGDRDGNF
jgi:catechol-2,3-dioxygenase